MGASTHTRRNFLKALAIAGGAAALYPAARALGLAPASTYKGPVNLGGRAEGQTVLILGAGLAGLTAAYELSKAGYRCQVLEARDRAGGRCWTVRGGDALPEGNQTADFDEGLYFDAGPDRIPQYHRAVLAYCKEFGLPMRAFVTLNTATYYYNENVGPLSGQKIRMRQAWTDLQGYTASLLARAVDRGKLSHTLSEDEAELMLAYLEQRGNLDDLLRYAGAGGAGYVTDPGAWAQAGERLEPFDFSALLESEVWRYFPFDWDLRLQMAQLQPRDGMDRLVNALVERVGPVIEYGVEVREIRRTPEGVRVTVQPGGQARELTGDFAICTLPLPVLANIPNDFPGPVQTALSRIAYLPAVTAGLQFARRFWEDDEFIYGGGSFTNLSIGQIWYPSGNYHAPKGILRGINAVGDAAQTLGDLAPSARIQEALTQGAKLHPQYPDEFESGVSVAWHKDPYSLGGWAVYSDEQRANEYAQLLDFDDRLWLAGDHLSYLNGWMEGAVLSAQQVVQKLHARATP